MKYAIVDIETTGGNAFTDRITEVAIYIHDGKKVVDEFSSLINPERPIPPYVARLTGISDEMVATAPRFYEIAKEIVNLTEDCVFVAHNVQFDYHFLRHEFRSLGYTYNRDQVCTVRLSRKLLPGHPSYSLGRLCERLGITLENRHRAGGDALATVRLFELLLETDKEDWISRSMKNDHLNVRFPPDFDRKIVDRLPEDAGVYYFHNEDGKVIYVGKSTNIRKRVLSHFANKQSRKAIELRNSIR
ncbi:MAG: exonuclease domain-containing protein, partial [Bacteroidota bacterium]